MTRSVAVSACQSALATKRQSNGQDGIIKISQQLWGRGMADVFTTLAQSRSLFAQLVERDVIDAVNARPPGPRNQKPDDEDVFGTLNTAMALLVSQQDFGLAKQMFFPCYRAALDYEKNNPGSEIHKGAPAFNMGVVCLRSYDFAAAMQYFELAETETVQTTGQTDWRLFLSDLFDRNFWDSVEAAAGPHPIPLFQDFWGVPWGKKTAKKNWWRVSSHSKLLFLINIAQRIRYRQLADQSQFPKSKSLAQSYWNLCSDLTRLLETEVYRRANIPAPKPYQLYKLLTQGFTATSLGNISTEISTLHVAMQVNSTATFNASFSAIRANIENAALPRLTRISNAIYLLYATRNQVQHHVDRRMILYRDPETAAFTADVLFTLCRLDSWTR